MSTKEFEPHLLLYEGIWVKFACGQVFVELDDSGKKLLAMVLTDRKAV